jgi:protocatechuate 3,4-dioxygenase beta subunit
MKTRFDYARSIRYAALVTMIAATSQACSTDKLVEPDVVTNPPSSQPTSEPTRNSIYGTVTDDDGVPVAGVKVTISRWGTYGQSSSTVTDSVGFYSFPFSGAGGISILTEKEGYETKFHSRTNPPDNFRFDLRIHRLG